MVPVIHAQLTLKLMVYLIIFVPLHFVSRLKLFVQMEAAGDVQLTRNPTEGQIQALGQFTKNGLLKDLQFLRLSQRMV
jgi:hypothetical protein